MLSDTFLMLLLTTFPGGAARQISTDPALLAPVMCEIVVVTPFGEPLKPAEPPRGEFAVDGRTVQLERERWITMSRGPHRVSVRVPGFWTLHQDVVVTEPAQRFMFCLSIGDEFAFRSGSISIEAKGSEASVEKCRELFVLPLHCAQSRAPVLTTLSHGRTTITGLPIGSYLFAVAEAARTCAVERVDVTGG
jgi:hypothetical protein